jgi:hypothetical protein
VVQYGVDASSVALARSSIVHVIRELMMKCTCTPLLGVALGMRTWARRWCARVARWEAHRFVGRPRDMRRSCGAVHCGSRGRVPWYARKYTYAARAV